jgi:MoxR-like ATPase
MSTLFEPTSSKTVTGHTEKVVGERGGGRIYVYDAKTVFAVQVAQVTGRPLLLRGAAGSGKSTLAPFVANVIDEPFYSITVTGRTQARDMMWEYDALRRLNDANVSSADPAAQKRVSSLFNYLTPGPLWWAFNREQAKQRGAGPDQLADEIGEAEDPGTEGTGESAVVLIDEIDKADPDVPNNLLEALGSRRFKVHETGTEVINHQDPLVIITTNEERQLPQAFLRRCVILSLAEKLPAELEIIAEQHFGERDDTLYADVAKAVETQRTEAENLGVRPPSTAEYLDTIAASRGLKVFLPKDLGVERLGDDEIVAETTKRWDYLIEIALSKRSQENKKAAEAGAGEISQESTEQG